MIQKPSPAIAIVGRHNSGKTTLVESTIAELTRRGYDIGSVKHHGHKGFDIDYPGKDSYRHRAAGATETVIVAPDKMARVKTLEHDLECSEIVASMPNHDLVIVEGYRKSGLPCIEIMRVWQKYLPRLLHRVFRLDLTLFSKFATNCFPASKYMSRFILICTRRCRMAKRWQL